MLVDLKPEEQWRPDITKEELIAKMEKMLDEMPGIQPTFSQPIRDNVLESISQIDGQIVIKIFGETRTCSRQKIEEVLKLITPDPGCRPRLRRSRRTRSAVAGGDRPGARGALRPERRRRPGCDRDGARRPAATQIWEGERKFGVVVRLREEERSDVDALRDPAAGCAGPSQIPLDQVAKIGVQDGVMNISREAGRSTAAIGVFIKGRDMGSLVQEMQTGSRGEGETAARATTSRGAASSRTSSARWGGCS